MSDGPLAGVRVLELGGIGPVPFATMLLADMGADVARLDRLEAVDGGGPGDPLSRGKRSVAVDLRSPEGRHLALDLAARADIVVEGFRPGVAERLGLGPDQCRDRNPRLVYGRMTGWGQSGPLARTAGHDINYIGLTGALFAIGREGQPPSIPLFLVGDLGGGAMFLIGGVLAALHEATRTGAGRVVDAAIVDGAARLMTPIFAAAAADEWVDERGANLLDSGRPWYDVYPTADGRWMSVGAIEDKFYAELIRVLALPARFADRDDPLIWPALRDALGERFASRTRDQWEAAFAGVDACVAPVLSVREAPTHPHLRARNTFVDVDGAALPAAAPRLDHQASDPGPPPSPGRLADPGAHTRSVIEAWTGRSDVDALLAGGVARQSVAPG